MPAQSRCACFCIFEEYRRRTNRQTLAPAELQMARRFGIHAVNTLPHGGGHVGSTRFDMTQAFAAFAPVAATLRLMAFQGNND